MNIVKQVAQLLTLILDWVIGSFFAGIILLTILQVILRYVFNAGILGGNEAMEALFIYTTSIGASLAVLRKRHININYFVGLLPKILRRLIDICVHLIIAFLNGVMIYFSVDWISKVGSNESPVLRVPEWIFQLSIPVGCGLVIMYCFIVILTIIWGEDFVGGEGKC